MKRSTVGAALFGTAAVLGSLRGHSAAVRQLEVEVERGCYRVFSVTYIDAAPEAVFALLADYDGFERISSIYKDSRFLEPDSQGHAIVYTRMEACLLFFCKSMSRVEVLETREPSFIRATVLPEHSDAYYGRSEWTIEAEGTGTVVVYRSTVEPSFKLPPLLGPWALQRSLRTHSAAAAQRIEEIANAAR